jgi:hypothetical protein
MKKGLGLSGNAFGIVAVAAVKFQQLLGIQAADRSADSDIESGIRVLCRYN